MKKTNNKDFAAVGARIVSSWEVVTACTGQDCKTTVTRDGEDVPIRQTATGWKSTNNYKPECIDFETGKPQKFLVSARTTRNLKVDTVTASTITSWSAPPDNGSSPPASTRRAQWWTSPTPSP